MYTLKAELLGSLMEEPITGNKLGGSFGDLLKPIAFYLS